MPPELPEEVLLRWSETPESPSVEELVELLQTRVREAVIRSTRKVREATRVYLIGKHYMGNGVVRSCRPEGNAFILNIVINEKVMVHYASELDPGVLTVEDFLTEEQEAQILQDLEKDTPRNAISPRTKSPSVGHHRPRIIDSITLFYRLMRAVPLVRNLCAYAQSFYARSAA